MTEKGISGLFQHSLEQIPRITLIRPAAFRQPRLTSLCEQFPDLRPLRNATLDEIRASQGENGNRLSTSAEAVESLTGIGMDDGKRFARRGSQNDAHDVDVVIGCKAPD